MIFLVIIHKTGSFFKCMVIENWPFPFSGQLGQGRFLLSIGNRCAIKWINDAVS